MGISEVCYDLELDLQLLQQIVEDVYIYKCMFTHKDTQTYIHIDIYKHTHMCMHRYR